MGKTLQTRRLSLCASKRLGGPSQLWTISALKDATQAMVPCAVVACSASAGHKDYLGLAALRFAYKTIMVYRVLVPVATVKEQIALWSVVCLHVWRRQLGMHAEVAFAVTVVAHAVRRAPR